MRNDSDGRSSGEDSDVHGETAGRWTVVPRSCGEKLVAEAGLDDVFVVVLSTTRDAVWDGAQDRLEALLLDSVEEDPPGRRVMSATVENTLYSLLDWKAEAEKQVEGVSFSSVLFFNSPTQPVVAHIGGSEPVVEADDHALAPRIFALRGEDGTVARTLCLRPGRLERITMKWSAFPDVHAARKAGIDGEWLSESAAPEKQPEDSSELSRLLEKVQTKVGDTAEASAVVEDAHVEEVADDTATTTHDESPAVEAESLASWADEISAGDALTVTGREESSLDLAEPAAAEPVVAEPVWLEATDTGLPATPIEPEPPAMPTLWQPAASSAPTPEVETPPAPRPLAPITPLPLPNVTTPGRATEAAPPGRRRVPEWQGQTPIALVPPPPPRYGSPDASAAATTPKRSTPRGLDLGRFAAVAASLGARAGEVLGRFRPALGAGTTNGRALALPTLRIPAWVQPGAFELPPLSKRALWVIGVIALLLFGCGWMLGRVPSSGSRKVSTDTPLAKVLRAIGIAGARYECVIDSQPEGARIIVDGHDVAHVTPATVELSPGDHRVTLRAGEWGGATYPVTGERGQRVNLSAVLRGSVVVTESGARGPVSVSVDNTSVGYAPIRIDHLTPGPHDVRFFMRGATPWGQIVNVWVNDVTNVVAQPFAGPNDGKVEIRATDLDDSGTSDIKGADVWVDGERRGRTPLSLRLPSGPHSIRASYRDEDAPIQVIDLPGGNERFATFEFGSGLDQPRLKLLPPSGPKNDHVWMVSAQLEGVSAGALDEMWLHTLTTEGIWRRYPMSALPAAGGVVGAAVLSTDLLIKSGSAYYISASTKTGDEYFTEIQNPHAL